MIAGLVAVALAATCYLPPVPAPITVPYVAPACKYCPGTRGVRYTLAPGTAVVAAAAGTVTFAGSVAGVRYLVVLHTDGLRATYGSLATHSVAAGQVVVQGAEVGRSGEQLYFGLRAADGTPIDPTPLLGQILRRARLVPADGAAPRPGSPPRLVCAVSPTGAARPP
jgi:murein DD-endopeptidase MepM/ murein hydrolase activator NlpD